MILRSLIAALLLLVLLAIVLVAGVLSSRAGNAFIVRWLEQQLEPRLAVTGLDGSLLTELCADRVRFEVPGVRIVVEGVCVAPNLWSSIDFLHVSLQSLAAKSVLVEVTPTGDEDAATEPRDAVLHLPIGIAVEALRVDTLRVNGFGIDGLDGALDIRNTDLSTTSSFSFAGHRVALRTRGPWDALRAEANALDVHAVVVGNLLEENLPFTLTAETAAFDLQPYVDREIGLGDVDLSGSGDLHGYRFDVAGNVVDPLARGHVQASGRGDWSGMAITALRLGDVAVTDLPLSFEEVTGRAQLSWSEAFSLVAESLQGRGRLTGREFRSDVGRLLIDTQGVSFEEASLRLFHDALAAVVHGDGHVSADQQVDLNVAGEAIPLAVLADGFGLADGLGGTGSLALTIRGPAERPSLHGTVALTSVAYGGTRLEGFRAEVDGFPDAARLTVTAHHADGDLDGRLAYAWHRDGTVLLDLQALEVRLAGVPAGARLLDATRLAIRSPPAGGGKPALAVALPETCLQLFSTDEALQAYLTTARLCVAVDYPAGGLSVQLEPWALPDLPLPAGGVVIHGTASASATLSSFEPLIGEANVALRDLVADHEADDRLELGRLDASLTVDGGTLELAVRSPPDTDQELALEGRVTAELAAPFTESPLAGELDLELDGIWAAKSLLPMEVTYELEHMQGVMGVQARIGGSVGEPLVNGVLTLNDVGALVLATNARFSNFGAEARLTDSQTIAFESRGSIGSGALAINGELVGLDGDTPRLTTRFLLDKAQVLELPDYSARLSGEVMLGMGSDDLSVTGELTLDEADISIADLPDTAVSPSADEVLVGEEAIVPTQQIRTTDVNVTLGKDVRLEAFGLTGQLRGSLRLKEAPRRLQSVTGTISLREAEFEAYGQVLQVKRGRLTFTGPIDNPTVDVEATKVVTYEERDYTISLLISGTAKELITTIRSQPSLAEDDALALLLTGRTISQISSQERSNVSGAAISMGLLNAIGVTQGVADRLNLEEIIVDQDDAGNMEFGAAVRLNRDVYLRYTYGVFSRLGGVLLRYRLSNRFSVQAKTGDSHSIEIRYGVD